MHALVCGDTPFDNAIGKGAVAAHKAQGGIQ